MALFSVSLTPQDSPINVVSDLKNNKAALKLQSIARMNSAKAIVEKKIEEKRAIQFIQLQNTGVIAHRIMMEFLPVNSIGYISMTNKELCKLNLMPSIQKDVENKRIEKAHNIIDKVKNSPGLNESEKALSLVQNATDQIPNDLIAFNIVLHHALEIAEMITGEWDKSNALSKISDKLAKNGKFDRAVEIAQMITCEYSKSEALRYIEKLQNP